MRRRFACVWLFLAGMLVGLPVVVVGQEPGQGVTIHVVQRGENLFRIALAYGLTVDELASLNGIVDPSNIQVGQRLLVPVENAPATQQIHIVQAGETLRSIADLYGLTVEELALRNEIVNVDVLYVGQELTLTPTAPSEPPTLQPTPMVQPTILPPAPLPVSLIYTVQPGETLFRIATRFGLTVNELARTNNIADPTLIYGGQRLVIPGVEPPQLALDLPPWITAVDVNPLILVEGQTARLRVTTASPMVISGSFLGRTIPAASEQENTFHTFLIGVPIFTQPGVFPFGLVAGDPAVQPNMFTVNLQVLEGGYGSETINLLADRNNLLDANVESTEQVLIEGIMGVFTLSRYWDGSMGLPAAASITSPFGRRRSYNGGAFDRFHSGTDFAGAPGAPVLAAAPGYVVLADLLNVRGNAVIVDHGWGVFTGYWHQTELYVQAGDFVSAGQVIGTIGATGRVSGAHLHWELWVNGVPVDPMQWVRQSFF